jgi:hypothetical protein
MSSNVETAPVFHGTLLPYLESLSYLFSPLNVPLDDGKNNFWLVFDDIHATEPFTAFKPNPYHKNRGSISGLPFSTCVRHIHIILSRLFVFPSFSFIPRLIYDWYCNRGLRIPDIFVEEFTGSKKGKQIQKRTFHLLYADATDLLLAEKVPFDIVLFKSFHSCQYFDLCL